MDSVGTFVFVDREPYFHQTKKGPKELETAYSLEEPNDEDFKINPEALVIDVEEDEVGNNPNVTEITIRGLKGDVLFHAFVKPPIAPAKGERKAKTFAYNAENYKEVPKGFQRRSWRRVVKEIMNFLNKYWEMDGDGKIGCLVHNAKHDRVAIASTTETWNQMKPEKDPVPKLHKSLDMYCTAHLTDCLFRAGKHIGLEDWAKGAEVVHAPMHTSYNDTKLLKYCTLLSLGALYPRGKNFVKAKNSDERISELAEAMMIPIDKKTKPVVAMARVMFDYNEKRIDKMKSKIPDQILKRRIKGGKLRILSKNVSTGDTEVIKEIEAPKKKKISKTADE